MSLQRKHALLIDDDEHFRLLVRKILEAQGILVAEAHSVEAAQEFLGRTRPDVILLDLNLSGGADGRQFLEHRQTVPALAQVPVIVVSAENQADIVRECVLYGANDYLLKPIKQSWLLQRIRKHLLHQALAAKKFAAAEAPEAQLEVAAQIVGLGEGHCVLRTQAKFLKDARGQLASELFVKEGIQTRELRANEDSRAGLQGLYDTTCTLLGITEREANTIRKLKSSWRSA